VNSPLLTAEEAAKEFGAAPPNKGIAADERGHASWLPWFCLARGLSRRASFDAFGATRAPAGVVASGSVVAGARS
jgi:hypothetical protein